MRYCLPEASVTMNAMRDLSGMIWDVENSRVVDSDLDPFINEPSHLSDGDPLNFTAVAGSARAIIAPQIEESIT